jgi:hypothetical protein
MVNQSTLRQGVEQACEKIKKYRGGLNGLLLIKKGRIASQEKYIAILSRLINQIRGKEDILLVLNDFIDAVLTIRIWISDYMNSAGSAINLNSNKFMLENLRKAEGHLGFAYWKVSMTYQAESGNDLVKLAYLRKAYAQHE